jgi:hypothetical protein
LPRRDVGSADRRGAPIVESLAFQVRPLGEGSLDQVEHRAVVRTGHEVSDRQATRQGLRLDRAVEVDPKDPRVMGNLVSVG